MPAGTPVEHTAAVMRELGAHLATVPEVTDYQAYAGVAAPINFNGLVRQYYLRAGGEVGDIQVNLVDKHRDRQSHEIAVSVRDRRCRPLASALVPTSKWSKCRRARRCWRPSSPRSMAPRPKAAAKSPKPCAQCLPKRRAWSISTTAASKTRRARCCWWTAAKPRCWACRSRPSSAPLRAGLAGEDGHLAARRQQIPGGRCRAATAARPARRHECAAATGGAQRQRRAGADPRAGDGERQPARAADPSQGPAAGELRRRRHGGPRGQPAVRHVQDAQRHCADHRARRRQGRGVLHPPAQRRLARLRAQVGWRVADHLRNLPRHGRGLCGRASC